VQEFIDRPSLWAEIVHPDDRYLSEKALEDLQNGGSAVRECRIVRPDGSIAWIHDRSKFIHDEHGIPVRVEGITSDITERERVQESLAESESFNRNLVENLPEYIAVYGMDGNLLYVNPASARTLGYDADTLIGTHVLSYIAEEYHETVIAKMTVRREGGEASPYEIEMVTRNGPRRSVIVKAAPIQYQENPATLLLLIDITERKQAEEALRQLSDRLSLATRAGGVGIWDYDVVNNTLTWDAQMFALYGITKEQFGGAYEAWQAGLSPEDKQRGDDEVQMALRGEKEFDTEFCVLWPDGSIRNIRAFALVQRDAWGKPIRMIGTNWDISERKELETEMKYHEQELTQFSKSLATANKKLTLLSSITRHDINNQLTVLMGFLAILKKKHSDTFTDEYFQKINAAAERISSMIRFTREYENIGVNAPVWQDCHTLVDTAAKEAPLGKVMVANDLPVGGEVFADQLITKVFYNLMDNAVRYGGKITTIRFSVEDSGDEHLIVCKDDGVGIPVEEKEKIFERGFGKNTGLGLFLSREILDITGITIKETGEPGKGARFEMTVPKGMYR
jgi:PAS domain S-box-containing protein